MNDEYHTRITFKALGQHFSPRALGTILAASLKQDEWRGQIGHPEFHFDDSAFEQGRKYLDLQRALIWRVLSSQQPALHLDQAWIAFGRLVHAAQDFYAHSNYVRLWIGKAGDGPWPAPEDIEPLDPSILNHSGLRSGRGTLLEMATFVLPWLKPVALPLLPPDSHAHMNLDNPTRGPLFPYAVEAACKRTEYELGQVSSRLTPAALAAFTDQPTAPVQ